MSKLRQAVVAAEAAEARAAEARAAWARAAEAWAVVARAVVAAEAEARAAEAAEAAEGEEMTREEIIGLARKAGLHMYINDVTEEPYALCLERFAALIAAAEREACAKLCFEEAPSLDGQLCAEAIRARGR